MIVLLPILIPMVTALSLVLAKRHIALQRLLHPLGAALHLGAGLMLATQVLREGIQVVHVGSWPAPYGIAMVADLLSAIMIVVTGLVHLTTALYSLAEAGEEDFRSGYAALLHFLVMGVSGAFLTGDLFNLYVWFEILLISSFVLMALQGKKAQFEGALKYVTLNLLSSALFLAGLGILYGLTGTLNIADLARLVPRMPASPLFTALSLMFLLAFGIKAAIFPLFSWLPASYHTPPVAVTAIFSGLLTKVGVYALIRVFGMIFVQDPGFTRPLLLWIGGLTMVTGVFGAVIQTDFRRLLSFHIISQIGYLIMGLGLMTVDGLAATILFLVHVIAAKSALFFTSGLIHRNAGTFDLKKLGGYYRASPLLSLLFLVPALSLAGLPPLSGFWGKFALVQAGLSSREWVITAVALGVSILTLFSMTKIWAEVFWKNAPDAASGISRSLHDHWTVLVPTALLGMVSLVLAIGAGPMADLTTEAARRILDPTAYITAVLGGMR